MKTYNERPTSFKLDIDGVVKRCAADYDQKTILIGPAKVYHEERWMLGCAALHKNGDFTPIMIDLGSYFPDVEDHPLYHRMDTVLVLSRPEDLTETEAYEVRHEVIMAMNREFKSVHVFDTERDTVEAMARIFPCAKSRAFRDNVIADLDART